MTFVKNENSTKMITSCSIRRVGRLAIWYAGANTNTNTGTMETKRFPHVFIAEVGIAAAIHLKKYIVSQTKVASKKKTKKKKENMQKFSLLVQVLSLVATNLGDAPTTTLRRSLCWTGITRRRSWTTRTERMRGTTWRNLLKTERGMKNPLNEMENPLLSR